MTAKIFRPIFLAAFAALILPSAFAKDAPTSAEQLRSEFESALKSKDTNTITSLIYWEGVSANARALDEQEAAAIVKHEITGVELAPWQTNNLPLEVEKDGVRYKPNLKVTGMLKVEFADRQGGVGAVLPFGKIGNGFLMAATVEEPVSTPAKKP